MTSPGSGKTTSPTIRVVPAAGVPAVVVTDGVVQRVLVGQPRADGSPLLLGITTVTAGATSALIEHDTAELAYVLAGTGEMVTHGGTHPFGPGDSLLIEPRCWHAIHAFDETVEMLFVFPTPSAPPTRHHPPS